MTNTPTLPKILVLGLGPGSAPEGLANFSELRGMDFIAASRQTAAALEGHPAEKAAVAPPLETLFARIEALRNAGGRAAVLAGGDPLFFGIGGTLVARFGSEALDIRPAVSSMQAAAAKIGYPWAGMAAVSLHGRDDRLPLAHALFAHGPVCLLTDERLDLAALLAELRERGVTGYTAHVFGRLGFPEESHAAFRLEEAADSAVFASPNVVFFVPETGVFPRPVPGTPDAGYAHEKGLITKWPVRAAALAALGIRPEHCVWDLGSGSGAVAVEAAALACRGRVAAVEKSAARAEHIRENRRRFCVPHLDLFVGTAPECLAELPDPDRVFIGGGLGGEEGAECLLRAVWERLPAGGRVVVSCVLLESLALCRELFEQFGAACDVLCLNAAQSAPLGRGERLVAQNPVFLASSEKGSEKGPEKRAEVKPTAPLPPA